MVDVCLVSIANIHKTPNVQLRFRVLPMNFRPHRLILDEDERGTSQEAAGTARYHQAP